MAEANTHIERQFIRRTHVLWAALVVVSALMGLLSLLVSPLLLVGVVVVIASVVVIFKYPYAGLLLYLTTFIMRPGELYPALEPLSIERIIGIFVLISALWAYKKKHGSLFVPRNFDFKMFILFWVVMLVSFGVSYDIQTSYFRAVDYFKLIIFYLIIVYTVDDRRKFDIFVGAFVVLIGMIAFLAFRDYYGGGAIYRMGIARAHGRTSAGGDPNSLALTLNAMLPLAWAYLRIYRNQIIRLSLIGVMGLCVLMIINTGSRAGLLALLTLIGMQILFSRHRLVAIVIMIPVLIGGWFMLPEQYQMRYLTLTKTEGNRDEISSGRISIWENGMRMFYAHPILGVGAGAFRKANATGNFGPAMDMQAHSIYVQLLATTGIVGTLVWFLFLGGVIAGLTRRAGPGGDDEEPDDDTRWVIYLRQAIISIYVVLLMGGMFAHSLYRFNWYLMAAIAYVLVTIYQSRRKADNSEKVLA